MAAVKDIFVDLQNERFVVSSTNSASFSWPRIFHTDDLHLAARFLKANPTGNQQTRPYTLVDISGASLTAKLYNSLGTTILASQSTWTKDTSNNILSAQLNLNTAAMVAAVGSSASITTQLELTLLLSDGQYTVRNDTLTIYRALNSAADPVPVPGQHHLTLEEAIGIFVQFISPAGATITLRSPDGSQERILGVDNDGNPTDGAMQ
jgi:hypothetical protein